MRFLGLHNALVAFAVLGATAASAEIAVSANDGKQIRLGDAQTGATPDSVSVLRLGRGAPKLIGSVAAPATMIGPPTTVAVAPDESFAFVLSSQKLDAANKLQPDGVLSVIDLRNPARPALRQQLPLGPGAMTVTLNRSATLALATTGGDDSVTIFSVARGTLIQVGKVVLEAKSEPRNVVISADGKAAYVVRYGDGKITKLAIDGTTVTRAGEIAVGVNPNSAVLSADGRYLFNTNFGGAASTTPKVGAVSTVDLRTATMVGAVEVGVVPEHIGMSPDGRHVVVVVGNGSAGVRTAPSFATVLGKLKLYRVEAGRLVPVAEADTGHNCQGAIFQKDNRTILLQCAVERSIDVYRFDGKTLTRDPAATLIFESRPGAIATATSR